MPARVITVRGRDAQEADTPDNELEDLLEELEGGEGEPGEQPTGAGAQPADMPPAAPPAEPDEPPDPGERDTTVIAQYFADDGEWDEENHNVGDFLEDRSSLKAVAEETLERFAKEPLLLDQALERIGEGADKEKIMARLKAAAALPDTDGPEKQRTTPVGESGE